jgi:hypothetical protein
MVTCIKYMCWLSREFKNRILVESFSESVPLRHHAVQRHHPPALLPPLHGCWCGRLVRKIDKVQLQDFIVQ